MKAAYRALGIGWLPPLGLFVLLVAIWQIAGTVWEFPPYLYPRPDRVWTAMREHADDLEQATLRTAGAALCGFAASLVVGVAVAVVFSQSGLIRRSVYPYAIFLQTVPSVALAPLVIIWFGTGFLSIVVVAFIISLFPIITNATVGLTTLDRNLVELFAIHNATRWQMLVKLRLPTALPFLITGAKVSAGLAVIGAIVGEFSAAHGMQSFGLGQLILQTSERLEVDYLCAANLAAMLLGVAIFTGVSLSGDWMLRRWHSPAGQGELDDQAASPRAMAAGPTASPQP